MPTKEQLQNTKLRNLTFKDSRDYRGNDFLDYVDPSFYRVDDTKVESFFKWDALRANREMIAINEPELTTALEYAPSKRVSPQIPVGIYKAGAEATVFYWIDGKQIQVRYKLVSLSAGNIETLSEQIGKQLLERFLQQYSEIARKINIFGLGNKLADVADYLQKQMNLPDIFGFWLKVQAIEEPIATVTAKRGASALEAYCALNPNDPICTGEKLKSSIPLSLLLTGAGLVTGQVWLSGLGLLLRFAGDSKTETDESKPLAQKDLISSIKRRGE